jgi:Caspase domain
MKLIQKRGLRFSVALAILLMAGWARAEAADCFVLSAGVDNYPGGNKLNGDLNDARNTVRAFTAQKGKLFAKVYATTLLDGQATGANFMNHFKSFSKQGKAGDFFVIFFSGHGGRFDNNHKWFFVPYDSTPVTSQQLLDASDVLIKQGKNVVIIIDACFSGQLNVDAKSYMSKYRTPNQGGLILMLSSSAEQTSNALGNYSAFAKAFSDAMTGQADVNHDGLITLQEIRNYTYRRTTQLLKQNHNSGRQDSVVAWSPSMSGNVPLGALRPQMSANPRLDVTKR